MGEFTAAWLALREPVDHAARSASVTHRVLDALPAGAVQILDLACGTGSNFRYLRDQLEARARQDTPLAAPHRWRLVDRDAALLARVPTAGNLALMQRDLSVLDPSLFEGCAIVTASALLDLVSEGWIEALVERCCRARAAVLFALTYDGRIDCEPSEPADALVRDLVNRHQRADKGFGPALGPAAAARTADVLTGAGYSVLSERSDWVLSADPDLQRQLIAGWADAATSIAPEERPAIDEWHRTRLAHVLAGRSVIRVGHVDIGGTR